MSKIEATKFELSLTAFEFEAMLQKAVNVVSFKIAEKHMSFSIRTDPDIPRFLIADDQRLTQVVTNLLTNAVKFTNERGAVRLNSYLVSRDGDICIIKIEVTDTGIGIDEEQQSRLFNSFQQADSGISRQFGGTGLGLAISKWIVQMMGGDIWVVSEPGKGSVFSFTVQARVAEIESESEGENGNGDEDGNEAASGGDENYDGCFEGRRILLVEDVEINREIVLTLLESTLLDIDCAENGEEALSLISGSPGKYNMIFMDLQMPKMDGYEATRRIRAMQAPEAFGIPIIAMTANVFREDVEKCLSIGMNDHLGKPLNFDEVMGMLKKYLPGNK
jgi:CheY-like chemotaxis protein